MYSMLRQKNELSQQGIQKKQVGQGMRKTKTISWRLTGACLACGSMEHKLSPSCPKYDPNYKANMLKRKEKLTNTTGKNQQIQNSNINNLENDKSIEINQNDDYICVLELNEILNCEISNKWMYDTGASLHVCKNKSDFFSYKPLLEGSHIKLGCSEGTTAIGIGTVKLRVRADNGYRIITLTDVHHIPDIRRNIISGYKSKKNGGKEDGCIDYIRLHFNGKTIFTAYLENKLYFVEAEIVRNEVNTIEDSSICVWHERMGHINKNYVINTSKVVKGLSEITQNKSTNSVAQVIDCTACCKGKMAKQPLPNRTSQRATEVGKRIHADIGGPVGASTYNQETYYILFKDEYSTFRFAWLMKSREEAFKRIEDVIRHIKANTNKEIRCLFTDRGSEFTSTRSEDLLLKNRITHEYSAQHRPEQNGLIERDNRTIMAGVRTMMIAKNVPSYLWGEALLTFIHILNRTINKKSYGVTPYQLYYSTDDYIKQPRIDYFRIFGCQAVYKVQTKKRSGYQKKVEERAREGIFVGYAQDYTYRIYDVNEKKIITTHDVKFDETKGAQEEPDLGFIENYVTIKR